ncbi:hypothetical protein AB0K80_11230 [Streptomyces sp. NPDC052682]|uniref:hypothetical protein n=1 Tax=Streptomyces sp. NPDC052682 TaxID=3154954 RepID=UPI00341BE16C
MPRRMTPEARLSPRGRAAVLCLLVLLLGSPWVQGPLVNLYWDLAASPYNSSSARWLIEGALFPGWSLSPDGSHRGMVLGLNDAGWLFLEAGRDGAVPVVNNVSIVVLLVALAFVAARMPGPGARSRLGCLVTGVLLSQLVAVLWWCLLMVFVDTFRPRADGLLRYLLSAPLSFGLALGALLAILSPAASRAPASAVGVRISGAVGAAQASLRHRKVRHGKEGVGMANPQLHMPVGRVPGDVTRYLCAAAYLDERFADRVVEEVLADEPGAVAPSPGTDLVAVVHHSLAARELRYRRDLRLATAFGVVALLAPLWLLFAATVLSVLAGGGRARPTLATRGRPEPRGTVLVSTGITAGVLLLCAFPLAALVGSWPVSGFPAWLCGAYLGGVPAGLASIGAVVFAYVTVVDDALDTDRLLRTTLTREAFAGQDLPPVPRREWIAERLEAVEEARDGNVTVYSGFSPFIGYADALSTWSLSVPLLPADDPVDRAARPAEPEPFTVPDLVEHVRARLRAAAARGSADAEALRSLTVEDRIFASGTAIRDDSRFLLPTRLSPAARLSPEAVEEIMLRPTGTVRHCLAVHVPLWGGDVVPSVFLHFSTAGTTLHLYCDNHVLGPVDAAYHVVDRLPDPLTPERRRGVLAAALAHTGPAFLGAPFRALRHARFEARHSRRMGDERTAMEQDPCFDYGARLSIREIAMSPRYHNYFQVVDAGRITAAVERHTLAAIREFLDTRGYDTTDFRAQQQTILNQGLIQQGGMSIIGNQAIGAGASATQHVTRPSGPAAAGAAAGSQQ